MLSIGTGMFFYYGMPQYYIHRQYISEKELAESRTFDEEIIAHFNGKFSATEVARLNLHKIKKYLPNAIKRKQVASFDVHKTSRRTQKSVLVDLSMRFPPFVTVR